MIQIPKKHLNSSGIYFIALILSILLPTHLAFAHGQGEPVSENAKTIGTQQKNRAENLTMQLSQMISAYHGTENASEKSALEEKLIVLAEKRKELLLEIMEIAPAMTIRLGLPKGLRENLPSNVQMLLEQKAEIEGELEVLYQDHEDPSKSRLLHFLKKDGEKYSIYFNERVPNLTSGNSVRVSGMLLNTDKEEDSIASDGVIAIDSDNVLLLAAGGGESTASSGAMPILDYTFGEQKTLVILVNFQDNPDDKPWTKEEVGNLVFGPVNDYIKENSFNQTWLAGDVAGWYTTSSDNVTCHTGRIANDALAAATEDLNVDPSLYDRYIFFFPYSTGCDFSGLATVGGIKTRAWINGQLNDGTVTHELGHNFGIRHAHALGCGDTSIGDNCTSYEYGDTMDRMGSTSSGHFNAFNKELLGWLNFDNMPSITTVDTSGTYNLDPYVQPGTNPKALKILKSTDPDTGNKTWYYVEYRLAQGFDSIINFKPDTNIPDGVLVHTGTELDARTSFLLDMTPNSMSRDWRDPALVTGESFFDPEAGVTITTDQVDNYGATVSVSYESGQCVQRNPDLSVSPSESQWVMPGTLITYTVIVTNNENSACGASTFMLSESIPSGWSAVFAEEAATLYPGESHSTTLDVTSSNTAGDGFYDINLLVENMNHTNYSSNALVTYVVDSGNDNQQPEAQDDSVETTAGTIVIIDALANDFDLDGDQLVIDSFAQPSSGTVVLNPDSTFTFTSDSRSKGWENFTYSITDGKANSSALVSIKFSKATGGGGKGKGNR